MLRQIKEGKQTSLWATSKLPADLRSNTPPLALSWLSLLSDQHARFCSLELLQALAHIPRCSLSPSAFLLSYQNRNDVILLVAPDGEKKRNPKSTVAAASSRLHVWSLSVCPSECLIAAHPAILTPLRLPQASVSGGRKEGPAVTQEGGFGEREGGSVKGCLSWS